jgi:hypothetical protein
MVLVICIGSISQAHAYLDPTTGSFFLQLLIGSIAGALMVIKAYWAKLVALFANRHQGPIDAKDEES